MEIEKKSSESNFSNFTWLVESLGQGLFFWSKNSTLWLPLPQTFQDYLSQQQRLVASQKLREKWSMKGSRGRGDSIYNPLTATRRKGTERMRKRWKKSRSSEKRLLKKNSKLSLLKIIKMKWRIKWRIWTVCISLTHLWTSWLRWLIPPRRKLATDTLKNTPDHIKPSDAYLFKTWPLFFHNLQ